MAKQCEWAQDKGRGADDSAETAPVADKFLTFMLDSEEYGVEILKVQEIIKVMDIPAAPGTPSFVKRVIKLRGKAIPVVDLRLKFHMAQIERTETTCVIVLEVTSVSSGSVIMGIIVDAVSQVLDIADDEIDPTPNPGLAVDTEFILGMVRAQGGVKILLDVDQVLCRDDVAATLADA